MSKIMLKNVKINYANLFHREVYQGKEGNFTATFLIDKEDIETKAVIDKAIKDLQDKYKTKVPLENICVKDGDNDEYNQGFWTLKASKKDSSPIVINKDKTAILESDNIIHNGCYVNAVIDFWYQKNYGKKINCNLYGVQFVKKGEDSVEVMGRFEDLRDESSADTLDEFEDL